MPGRGKHGPRAEPLQPVASPQPLPHQGQLQSGWRQLQEELAGDNKSADGRGGNTIGGPSGLEATILGLEASDATPSVWVEPAEPRPPPNLTKESGCAIPAASAPRQVHGRMCSLLSRWDAPPSCRARGHIMHACVSAHGGCHVRNLSHDLTMQR